MKNFIFIALAFFLSVESFATSESYCTDSSKRILFVNVDAALNSSLRRDSISQGEVVVNVGKDKSVIVPCLKNYPVAKNAGPVESLIVAKQNIFIPLTARIDGMLTLGANYEDGTVLSHDITLFVLKSFVIKKSPSLSSDRRNALR